MDKATFEQLYRQMLPGLYRLALSILRHGADAQDAVQQAAYDGQGVNVLARIAPKRPEEYALFNSWMMDRGDMYDVSWEPDEVATGTQESNIIEGGVKIVNENGAQAYYEAGKEVPIPEGREAAMAAGCMIYPSSASTWACAPPRTIRHRTLRSTA